MCLRRVQCLIYFKGPLYRPPYSIAARYSSGFQNNNCFPNANFRSFRLVFTKSQTYLVSTTTSYFVCLNMLLSFIKSLDKQLKYFRLGLGQGQTQYCITEFINVCNVNLGRFK